jgi:hypothetical protein
MLSAVRIGGSSGNGLSRTNGDLLIIAAEFGPRTSRI